ncbi:hypothetical protein [Dankookia sp. P2]|uniref:hypothetical protein n=1 Tax=Dankookia sp. P2 TaxID=3423955 RepID=UPI003D667697
MVPIMILHRVALDQPQHGARHRVEQPGIDHDAEIQDGKQQQHAGRRQVADAGDHHRPHGAGEAADQGEGDRHQDQRQQRREPVRHDQRHEDQHHAIGEQCQHASSPAAAMRVDRMAARRGIALGSGAAAGPCAFA